MSTTAYTNRKTGEVNTFGEKIVFSLLKILLPPHKDNMLAADYLVYKLGSKTNIDWVAVRPDSFSMRKMLVNMNYIIIKHEAPFLTPAKQAE
jgi:hypothetical protein